MKLDCTILYCNILYHAVLYCTLLYHTFTFLDDTHLLIKLFMLGPLDKSLMVVGGGDIAIIATSSRSRSDFEIDFEIETNLEIEI